MPGIRLVNAYGLTETSDDTNHEVMDRVPDADLVPLGRPVSNVHVYVRRRAPVPGAARRARRDRRSPGSASAAATSTTPSAPGRPSWPTRTARGQRLYLAGDYGRWRPDGKLEFLGRRGHPGQDPRLPDRDRRDREHAAAGARGPRRRRGGRRAGRPEQAPGGLLRRAAAGGRRRAARPAGRVAAGVHGAVGVPLAGAAAADRQQQDRPEGADRARRRSSPLPRTTTTRRARRPSSGWRPPGPRCWASRRTRSAGRTTSSTCGGTSLSAVQLAIALDRAVSLKDVTEHPVLADLAGVIDGRSGFSVTSGLFVTR